MVSLRISRVGKAYRGSPGTIFAYVRLGLAGYLSWRALIHPRAVVAAIAGAEEEFAAGQPGNIGDEAWRHVEAALAHAGYLSWWGRSWGARYTRR